MSAAMKKIGLALSGGGFRASLYHLGLVRFLRDAGILPQVTHITSVSGGSILAAHLVLNWDRYNGSPTEFDAAAAELLAFVRLDVRNRIIRRFPLAIPVRWLRRFMGLSNRKLKRTGLLEYHYEQYLYGDTSLFELPEKPQLHILATNLSEGCLCSFSRDGLLTVRRQSDGSFRIQRIHIGLATVPMAVTASSAFPGFFPPLELTGAEVGANVGEFGRQAYTDGGVFDNLGVRMFRCLERPLLAETPLAREDSSISRRQSRSFARQANRARKRRFVGCRSSCLQAAAHPIRCYSRTWRP
jgi:predicted acylesterase/phospholipase RssA